MAGSTVFERQRGQRPEHAPKNPQGETVEPGTLPEDEANPMSVSFEEAEQVLFSAESSIIANQTLTQRHGCVEQRRGLQTMDDAGNVINPTEMWRCQCGVRFQGKTIAATQELYLAHIRKYDPDVPPARFKG